MPSLHDRPPYVSLDELAGPIAQTAIERFHLACDGLDLLNPPIELVRPESGLLAALAPVPRLWVPVLRLHVPAAVRIQLTKDGKRCGFCGVDDEDPATEFEIDHRVPVWCGGATNRWNLHWTCRWCNRSKGGRLVPRRRPRARTSRRRALFDPDLADRSIPPLCPAR